MVMRQADTALTMPAMLAAPSHADERAVIAYQGSGLDAAQAWAELPADVRRRRAVQACKDHDATALAEIALAWLTLHGRRGATVSPYTRRNYAQGIGTLVEAWRGENLLHPSRHAAALWLRQLEGVGLKPSTVMIRLAAARALYRALRDAGATDADPFKDVRAATDPVPDHEKRHPYPQPDVDRLLAVASGDDLALVLLGAHAGLRIAEILALRWEDVNLPAGELVVRNGKGGRRRTVPLSPTLAAALATLRAQQPADSAGWVIPYRTPFSARYHLQALATRAGVAYRGLHALRHTAGTRLVAQTGSLELAAGMLGHSSLDTTRVYAKWSDDSLRAALGEW